MKIRYQGPVKAPIAKGQHIADLVVTTPDTGEQVMPLVAAEAVERSRLLRPHLDRPQATGRNGLTRAPGRFISLEGGEGAGKSTQLEALAEALHGRGLRRARSPASRAAARAPRRSASCFWKARRSLEPRAEALLFAAARSDHVEKTIQPALERGEWVLERSLPRQLAGLPGRAGGLGIDAVRDLHRFGSLDFFPTAHWC